MTDDLNERVAMAMGWEFKSFALNPLWVSPNGKDILASAPDYRTDPATIPEMHAFLAAHAFKNGWHSYSLTWQGATAGGWQACFCRVEPDLIEWGATLNEALARLVCAVAEAKR